MVIFAGLACGTRGFSFQAACYSYHAYHNASVADQNVEPRYLCCLQGFLDSLEIRHVKLDKVRSHALRLDFFSHGACSILVGSGEVYTLWLVIGKMQGRLSANTISACADTSVQVH